MDVEDHLHLLDWRRRIFDLYGQVRAHGDPVAAWKLWRGVRDELMATHPQSPLTPAVRAGFEGLTYFEYDAAARVLAEVHKADLQQLELPSSTGDVYSFTRVGRAYCSLYGRPVALELYWLGGYAGGLFVPFKDLTCGSSTYGGGRYVLDTAKGADLGTVGGRLVLDFNFSYNPSCSYDPRWTCPLAPMANNIGLEVRAGEINRPEGETGEAGARV
jgi:uncharacterized protein